MNVYGVEEGCSVRRGEDECLGVEEGCSGREVVYLKRFSIGG